MSKLLIGGLSPVALYLDGQTVQAVYYEGQLVWPDGTRVSVPASRVHWADYAPAILTGVNVALPLDAMDWEDFVPEVFIEDLSAVPTDAMDWEDFAPGIAAGAHIAFPLDEMEWADFSPSVSISIVARPPVDLMDWTDYAPGVAAGANVEWLRDELVWTSYAPTVFAGANILVPTSLMDWRDFGVITGYDFSTDFSSDFNAIPSASGAAVPVNEMVWTDYAPTVEAQSLVDVEFLGLSEVDSSFANSISVTGFDFGAAAAGLKIVVVAHFFGSTSGAAPQITGGTIGGVSISTIHDLSFNSSSIADFGTWLIGVDLPGGGTGDISLSFSKSVYCRLAVYRVIGAGSFTPTDIGQNTWSATTSSPKTADADVAAGGAFFAAMTVWMDGGSSPLSGVTPDYNTSITSDTNYRISCGFEALPAATPNKTATVTKSGGGNWFGAFTATSLR